MTTTLIKGRALPPLYGTPIAAIDTPCGAFTMSEDFRKKYANKQAFDFDTRPGVNSDVYYGSIAGAPKRSVMRTLGQDFDSSSRTVTNGFMPATPHPRLPAVVDNGFLASLDDTLKERIKRSTVTSQYEFAGVTAASVNTKDGITKAPDSRGYPLFITGYSTICARVQKMGQRRFNAFEPLVLSLSEVNDKTIGNDLNTAAVRAGDFYGFSLAPLSADTVEDAVMESTHFHNYHRAVQAQNWHAGTSNIDTDENTFLSGKFDTANRLEEGIMSVVVCVAHMLTLEPELLYARISKCLMLTSDIHAKYVDSERNALGVSETEIVKQSIPIIPLNGELSQDEKYKLLRLFAMRFFDIQRTLMEGEDGETENRYIDEKYTAYQDDPYLQKVRNTHLKQLCWGFSSILRQMMPVAKFVAYTDAEQDSVLQSYDILY